MPCPRHRDSMEGAVELMSAWLTRPDGPPDLLLGTLEQRIEEHPSGDRLVAAVELIMGLTSLCGSLLALRELDNGIAGWQTIQDLQCGLADEGFGEDDDTTAARPHTGGNDIISSGQAATPPQ